MKQLMYIKKNKLEWHDAKEPTLKSAGDVIVRPLAAARCDGDKLFLFNDITRNVGGRHGYALLRPCN